MQPLSFDFVCFNFGIIWCTRRNFGYGDEKIKVNMSVTANNGCEFEVTGWVDISIGFGGMVVNGYDITASGPCGTYHFQGRIAPPADDDDIEISDSDVQDIVTDIVNQNIE